MNCLDCGLPKKIKARGLCDGCYGRNYNAGTVDQYPTRPTLADGPQVPELTYRRLDYWTTKGYLKSHKANPGTGYRRAWPESERAVARLMVRLTEAGLTVDAAAKVARAGGVCELAPGVRVEVAAS